MNPTRTALAPDAPAADDRCRLRLSVQRRDQHVWIAAAGDLDLATAPTLAEALNRVPPGAHPSVLLDLGGLAFCDCAGLSVLLAAHQRLCTAGGALVLLDPPPPIRRLLALTNLDRHLDIRADARRAERPARPDGLRNQDRRTGERQDRPMEIGKDELFRLLRRIGRPDLIEEVDRAFPDPVDTIRDARLLTRYGLTRSQLTDRLGASP